MLQTRPSPAAALAGMKDVLATLQPSASALNEFAWAVHVEAVVDGYRDAEAWARQALRQAPGDPHIVHTLATLLGDQNEWQEALRLVDTLLEAVIGKGFEAAAVAELLETAAAAGHADAVVGLLTASPAAQFFRELQARLADDGPR